MSDHRDCVLVTGASGYIAKHIIQLLLKEGKYRVRGTVRSDKGEAAVRSLFGQNVEIVRADLTTNDSGEWDRAVKGCKYVLHVAAPLPIKEPRNREALVPATRDGTVRVLQAALNATHVERIVLTSSLFTMMYRPGRPSHVHVDEKDWTDPEWKMLGADEVAKTRAELAAWELVKEDPNKLVVVNPGWALGPVMDDADSFSSNAIQLFMKGAYPAVPPVSYAMVDVRDVAAVHVQAMTCPQVAGKRLIACSETLSFPELAKVLREAFPEYKVPKHVFPKWVVRFLALFDRTLHNVVKDMDCIVEADSGYVSKLLHVEFRPVNETLVAMGQSLIDNGLLN